MPSSVSISLVILVWITTIIIINHVGSANTSTVAKPQSPPLAQEAKALNQTQWWWWWRNEKTTSNLCKWDGIVCNDGGSVIEINLNSPIWYENAKFCNFNFNFSSFPNLVRFKLAGMGLYGSIPPEIGSVSKLTYLNLSWNSLSGELPLSLAKLTQLEKLDISFNQMSGPIPLQLGNLSSLVELYLGGNYFSGTIPSTLGLLTRLTHLDLHSNQINGTIPSEIYNLENLMVLHLGTNNLFGPISSKIGNLKDVVSLNLSHNLLIGPLPHTLTNLRSLVKLNLGGNFFNSTIPTEICNIKGLMTLHLGKNNLFGPLPYELSRLTRLRYLNLSSNKLSGRISTNLQNLVHLSVLDLSHNKLSGPLPTQLTNLHALEQLLLSRNNLTGSIPPQLGNLSFLLCLDLSRNNFTGNIPPNLVFWHYLVFWREMDLSFNSLTGPLPECFCYYFGPETIMGNKDLRCEENIPASDYCFGSPHINIGSTSTENVTKWIKIILPIVISFIFLLLGIVLLSRQKIIGNTGSECKAKRNGDILSIWNYDGNIAFEDIITATEDFDIRYCIGTDGYGSVYRAMLPSGKVIALKKLHRLESQEPTFDKSFKNEAKVLSEVRHRNIVKLYGYCLHKQCMFLVYEYMEKGSLFYAISNDVTAKELDWKKRVNIIKGIANALSYLHHDCIPTIIHRDLTTSNILLNSELEAFVADFGIARPLNPDSSNLTTLAGTYGYIAPEIKLENDGVL
nr:probable leucine-rich repeat receptor-like protein kinase At1g35710 [Quercus suber]